MATRKLQNRYFCKWGEDIAPERMEYEDPDYVLPKGVTRQQKSPGYELFLSTDRAYNVRDPDTITKIKNEFSKARNAWFKFVLFHLPDDPENIQMYIIYGNDEENKHSVCYLYGIYENGGPEYENIRELMNFIIQAKSEGVVMNENTPEIIALNKEIFRVSGCMDVDASGSATYLGKKGRKDLLCINTKSGHYLPSLELLEFVKDNYLGTFFPRNNWVIDVRKNITSDASLKAVYGEDYKKYTGTCFTEEEEAFVASTKTKKTKSKKGGKTKRRRR